MVDISALLSDQPLIDEGGSEGVDENQLDAIEGTGADYTGSGDEPPEGDEDGGDPPPQRNQKVPLAALHEERTKRQELEQRTREQQALIDKANERLAKLFEAQQVQQQPQAPQEAVPAFTDDPEAAFNHVQRQLAETQRQMQEYVASVNQQQSQQVQFQQLAQSVSAQEAQFTQTVPDYPTAADFFYQRKVAEYAAFTGDEFAAKQQVANDYKGIANLAQRLGKNPAELMYNAAKAMGYVPGQQQRTPQQQQKAPPTSLANAHGSTRAPDEKGAITAADIANMSEKEFDDFFNGMARKGVQRPKI